MSHTVTVTPAPRPDTGLHDTRRCHTAWGFLLSVLAAAVGGYVTAIAVCAVVEMIVSGMTP